MDVSVACIAGEEVYRQWQAGRISGRTLPARHTPFGPSAEIFRAEGKSGGYYLLARHGLGMAKTAPGQINHKANLYALKDIGVSVILAWGPGAAVRHSIAVGDLVVLSDVIDWTGREATFFQNNPLGFLRQMPVFCPALSQAVNEAIGQMKLSSHAAGTAAVTGGPRFETPAEIRMLGTMGADVVTHYFAPDVFLAKELEMCYAAVCYVVNYAETGSRHRPFATGDLFGGLTQRTDAQRLAGAVGSMGPVIEAVAERVACRKIDCECLHTMDVYRKRYSLPEDWRGWLALPRTPK
jgi:5'-methylthioadenosine phosphorylase